MTGRAHALDLVPGLLPLARSQDGVLHRDQLRELGVSHRHVRRQVDAERWRVYGPHAVVLQTGALSRAQRRAVAVVHSGKRAALAGRSALECDGMKGWEADAVHVLVPHGQQPKPFPGVVVHQTRRLPPADLRVGAWPPRTRAARAAIDAAGWELYGRSACGLLLAAVRQRLVTVPELADQLALDGTVRHRALLNAVLVDAAGGADAESEVAMARLVRAVGLPEPCRQVVVETAEGPRRVDLAVRLPDGRTLVIEVDGPHHTDVRVREEDAAKDAALVAAGYVVLRIPVTLLRRSPATVRAQLMAIASAARARAAGREVGGAIPS